MAGRKPKPTQLKIMEGNPGRRPLNENEPLPKKLEMLPAPQDWLLPESIDEWNRIGQELIDIGVLTVADISTFAAYCQCWGRYLQMQKWMSENDIVQVFEKYSQQAPQVGIAKAMLDKIRQYGAEFGLSPASRVRLDGVGGEKTSTSKLAEFAKRQSETLSAPAPKTTVRKKKKA